MARPKKTKVEDLARIRNNQRKCRERRRRYIAELEQKVKYYEKERVQSSTGLQTKARKNEVLEGLHEPSSDWEDTSTRTQTPWHIYFEPGEFQGELLGREATHTFPNFADPPVLLDRSNSSELNQDFAPCQAFFDSAALIHDARVHVPTHFPAATPLCAPPATTGTEKIICDSFQPASSLTLWPVLTDEMAREDRSMLCSIAYRLILQFNKRQCDDLEIEIKISCGFRLGRTQLEGCRVDIEVLFAVLAEISS